MTNSETRTDISVGSVIDAMKRGIDDARSRGIVVSRVMMNVDDWNQYVGVKSVDTVPVWTSHHVPRGQATVDGPGNRAALSLMLYHPSLAEESKAAAPAVDVFRGNIPMAPNVPPVGWYGCTCRTKSDCPVHRETVGNWSLPAEGQPARVEMELRDEVYTLRARVKELEAENAAHRTHRDPEPGSVIFATKASGYREVDRLRLEVAALRAQLRPAPDPTKSVLMTDDYYDE